MRITELISKDPIEAFDSKFKYAWNSEKGKPRITAEHYCVTWSIESLSLLMFEENKSVSSPFFILGSSKTEWFIELSPHGLCREDHNIDLFLYRYDDNGPQKVGLTFRFGASVNENETLWWKEKKVEYFKQKTFHSVRVSAVERERLSESIYKCHDLFVVKCEMYVTFPVSHCDESLLKPADYDLINFSFDFTKLMMAIEITDYRVKIPGMNINTHKAILAARSPTFREILRDQNFSSEIDLRDASLDNIRRVLNFMYSGNVSVALKGEPPSIGLYECAEKFAVVDLVDLLVPKYLRLRTVLKSQHLVYTWRVPHFTNRPAFILSSIKSPPFGSPTEYAPKWCLIADFNQTSDQLGIFVQTTEETDALHSVLKISLLDGNGELFNTKTTTDFKEPREKFGFPEFLGDFTNQNTMYDLLINDTLRIHCHLNFVFSNTYHEAHDVTISGSSNFLDALRNLSNNIKELFDTSAFSDVSVKTWDDTILEVHRPVLFARSRKFYSKFMYYNKHDRILEVYDIEPDLVRLMIEHAYSGILNQGAVDDMLRLHKAADLYVFRGLSLITHSLLASSIHTGNFFELLVDAQKHKDRYLEEKCMVYVRDHAKRIMLTADWDKFRNKDKELCDFLATVLSQEALKQ